MEIYSVIILFLIFLFSSLYDMQMLQQHSYNENNSFLKYIFKDYIKNYDIYLIEIILAVYILLLGFTKLSIIAFIICSLVLLINAFLKRIKYNDKLPLKYTKRVLRILLLDYLLFTIVSLLLKNLGINAYIFGTLLYIILHNFILLIVVFILKPVELIIFNKYKKKALSKLERMQDLKIIGITGSFGKTSTKMILQSILKEKYKGFYTPASFNTPNGILMTINNEESIFNEYFICEMGAKRLGEIKELCALANPKYGIITSIGEAHLESFKTLDNILNTKMELLESIPNDGIVILNKDDLYMPKYKAKSKCKKVWIGINKKADVMAENIKTTDKGTTFDVIYKSGKFKVSTVLLGIKNVYNILSAIALSLELGLSKKEIQNGVKNIESINHRLELKKINNLTTIIDDSFNSNPEGAKSAVDVLSLMEGKKIIITPGMVEMGDKENELNKEFGKEIAISADLVYLVGPKHTKPIYDGLLENGFKKENIKIFKSFKEGYNDIMKVSGKKTILIENDLPDAYTEE